MTVFSVQLCQIVLVSLIMSLDNLDLVFVFGRNFHDKIELETTFGVNASDLPVESLIVRLVQLPLRQFVKLLPGYFTEELKSVEFAEQLNCVVDSRVCFDQ